MDKTSATKLIDYYSDIINTAAREIEKICDATGDKPNIVDRLTITLRTDDILFKSLDDARVIYENLKKMANEQGYVTVQDFFSFVSLSEPAPRICNVKFGWGKEDIGKVKIYSTDRGYRYLSFPPLAIRRNSLN